MLLLKFWTRYHGLSTTSSDNICQSKSLVVWPLACGILRYMPFRVLVCGSRHWSSYLPVRRELAKLPSDTIVIHGDCAGADRMAAIAAKYLDLQDVQFKADWDKHGPA